MSPLIGILPELRQSANQAMWASWHGAGLHKGVPNEVLCIKNLVKVALPGIAAEWTASLKRIGLQAQLQGVVCHGHPWVSYPGAPKRCELGDLLLVHDHQPRSGPLQRYAALVQAKIFHRTGVQTSSQNPVQLGLYQQWPRFTYESWPGGIDNLASVHKRAGLNDALPLLRQRKLTITGTASRSPASANMLNDGCRYGMIDVEHSRWGNPKTSMNPWRLCSALSPKLYASKAGITLGSYLVKLMAGKVGRHVPVTAWPSTLSDACHWSLMVTELLSILPDAPFSGSSKIAFLAATPNLNLATSTPPTSIPTYIDGTGDGEFAIIRVQTFADIGDRPRRKKQP